MTFSRRYAEQNVALKHLRETIPIGIFGSFSEEYLQVLRDTQNFLNNNGFARVKLSYDLSEENPQNPMEKEDVYNLRMSDLLLEESDVGIFFIFCQNDASINVNESALMELAAHRKTKDNNSAFLLIQIGAELAGVARGIRGCYQYEEFDVPQSAFRSALKFCQNRVHEIIRIHT